MLNRRKMLSWLGAAAAASVAAPLLKFEAAALEAPPLVVVDLYSDFSELVATTLRNRSAYFVENVTRNNALMRRLQSQPKRMRV